MSNTITVNLENLTDAERQQLMTIVEKSQKSKQWWKGTKFDIKDSNDYCYVNSQGIVEYDINEGDITVNNCIAFGNACVKREYMERRSKEIKLYNLLSNFAEVVNEGWQPDWEDYSMSKHFLTYYRKKEWRITATYCFENPTTVYFESKELAQRAIDEIVLPFERGEL